MTSLSVNLNKIALLRNSRGRNHPNVIAYADRALRAGAAGITLHPRPDQRHAKFSDVQSVKELLLNFPGKELNVEGYPDKKFIEEILKVRPHQCTLVPDKPEQLTSDQGWDVKTNMELLQSTIIELQKENIRVSIFIDPIIDNIHIAKDTGADRVELYTEQYAMAFGTSIHSAVLRQYVSAALYAIECGFGVNAGHDLNLSNVWMLTNEAPIDEVSIGHALVIESLDYGFDETIRRYVTALGGEFQFEAI